VRIFGSILLLGGFLLCLTIDWLPIGLFAMGFGLIFFLVSDSRRRKNALNAGPAKKFAPPDKVRSLAGRSTRTTSVPDNIDLANEWRSLAQHDPELTEVEQILSQYGPQYANQLARVYLVFKKKAFLPTIVDMVIASAKSDGEPGQLPRAPYQTTAKADGGRVPAALIATHQADKSDLRTKQSYLPAESDQPPTVDKDSEKETLDSTAAEVRAEDPLKQLFAAIESGTRPKRAS
jgi:hypothetical protein